MKYIIPISIIASIIIASIIIALLVVEICAYSVFGFPIDENKWTPYVERRIKKAHLDLSLSKDMIFTDREPFVKSVEGVLYKWRIHNVGPIYRWSKLSMRLDKVYDSLEHIGIPEYAQ